VLKIGKGSASNGGVVRCLGLQIGWDVIVVCGYHYSGNPFLKLKSVKWMVKRSFSVIGELGIVFFCQS